MHAIVEGVSSIRERRAALEAQAGPTPPADQGPDSGSPEPTSTDTAPPLTIHGHTKPGAGAPPVEVPASVVEPSPAPVVMPDPEMVAARARAQQQAVAIPDKTLDKVAGAIALADPAAAGSDGTVRVPLSIEEAAALKQAGINVDDNGSMPVADAAGLVTERNRRDAAALAKKLGQWFHVSPMVVDQVLSSSGGTAAKDTSKALMTLRTFGKAFPPELRQLHPLERSAALGSILSSVTRDLAASHLQVMDRSRAGGQARQFIDVEPTTARAIANTVGSWLAEDMRNGLTTAGEPGYANYDLIDTTPRLDAIFEADPAVGAEIRKRIDMAHILPAETVSNLWPEVESRLLQDREKAKLAELLPSGHLTPRKSAKRRSF